MAMKQSIIYPRKEDAAKRKSVKTCDVVSYHCDTKKCSLHQPITFFKKYLSYFGTFHGPPEGASRPTG